MALAVFSCKLQTERKTLEKSSIKRYYSNDSLFILKEFLNGKNLQTLQGANQNSPDETGSNSDLLVTE
ncbi:MAG: hypothetical protein ACE5IT_08165 [bacterium]